MCDCMNKEVFNYIFKMLSEKMKQGKTEKQTAEKDKYRRYSGWTDRCTQTHTDRQTQVNRPTDKHTYI